MIGAQERNRPGASAIFMDWDEFDTLHDGFIVSASEA